MASNKERNITAEKTAITLREQKAALYQGRPLGSSAVSDIAQGSFAKTSMPLSEIIGLPPAVIRSSLDGGLTERFMLASMPIMAIYPLESEIGAGQGNTGSHLLNLKSGKDKYNKILEFAGVPGIRGECIYVSFLNETSIAESLTNDYQDSMVEEAANSAAPELLKELSAITGTTNMSEMASKLNDAMSRNSGTLGSILKTPLQGLIGGIGALGGGAQDMMNVLAPGMGGMGVGKQDFPMIWKGSSYSPLYSFTIRLYNPYPEDPDAHREYIVAPIAKIAALGMPVTTPGDNSYNAPLLCSVVCPGLFLLKAAYISSLDIVKGGDANNISFQQRPGIVDLRLSIGSLYSSIVANLGPPGGGQDPFRPTFGDYVRHLQTMCTIPNIFSATNALLEDVEGHYQEVPPPGATTSPFVAYGTATAPKPRVSANAAQTATRMGDD